MLRRIASQPASLQPCAACKQATAQRLAWAAATFSTTSTRYIKPRYNKFNPHVRRSNSRKVPAWKGREAQIRSELKELEEQLDRLEKERKAARAAEKLPKLDEESLEQVYSGLMEPEPIPESELKRLEAQETKALERYARVVQQARLKFPRKATPEEIQAPLTFSQRMRLRLEELSDRLNTIQTSIAAPGSSSTSSSPTTIADLKQQAQELKDSMDSESERGATSEDALSSQQADETGEHSAYQDFETLSFPEQGSNRAQSSEPGPSSVRSDNAALAESTNDDIDPTKLVQQIETLLQRSEQSQDQAGPVISAILDQDWRDIGVALAQRKNLEDLHKTFTLIEGLVAQGKIKVPALTRFYDSVADAFGDRGDHENCELVLGRMIDSGLQPSSWSHHALVKAYMKAPDHRIDQALALLHALEDSPTPASEATYSLVLVHLVNSNQPAIRDQAWGVWYRMRLNAYPSPDAVTWSRMLRACAMGSTPSRGSGVELEEAHRGSGQRSSRADFRRRNPQYGQAEAALDLFREMTVVNGIQPSPSCFDSLILACCRSGMHLQGFKFLQDMIEMSQESKIASYEPTRATFNALLEGCRINKDLLRARWVLAEMIRSSAPLWADPSKVEFLDWHERAKLESRMPDAKSLSRLFLTYAAFKLKPPQVRPKNANTSPETQEPQSDDAEAQDEGDAETAQPPVSQEEGSENRSLTQPEMDEAASEFSSTPPATPAEMVREVRGLLARAIADHIQPGMLPTGPMSCVELTTQLINSYLTALIAHLPKNQKIEALSKGVRPGEHSLFTRLNIQPNGHTYNLVLQGCFSVKSNDATNELADWAWEQWRKFEDDANAANRQERDDGTDKRSREVTWLNRINVLAKAGRLQEGMDTLKKFAELYPPQPTPVSPPELDRKMPLFDVKATLKIVQQYSALELLRQPPNSPPALSSPDSPRIASPAAEEADATSHASGQEAHDEATIATSSKSNMQWIDRPPSLTFFDLNLLHQRLLELGASGGGVMDGSTREAHLAYIDWLCITWEKTESKATESARRQEAMRRLGMTRQQSPSVAPVVPALEDVMPKLPSQGEVKGVK